MDYKKEKLDYFEAMKKFSEEKVAIRKGCPNIGGCHCPGTCQEIIGWRDKTESEKNPHLFEQIIH